jgi:recombination protein RecA
MTKDFDKTLETFRKKIEKEFGEIFYDPSEDIVTISTGVPSLDISTGVGGFPRKRISVVYGSESSGKTTLMLNTSKSILEKGGKVLYIDSELSLDMDYVQKIFGEDIDITRFVALQPNTAEDIFQIAEIGIHGNNKFGIEAGEFDLIIIDSLGSLAPEKEKKDKFTDSNVALLARDLTKFLRRNMYGIKHHNVAVVFIGQVRASVGGFVQGFSIPGGHALKHYSSIIVMLSKISNVKDSNDEIIGVNIKYTIKKNKVGKPYRSFTFPLMFDTGISKSKDILDFAELLGYIDKRGAFYYHGDTKLGHGYLKASEYLDEHNELLDELIVKCYNSVGSTMNY